MKVSKHRFAERAEGCYLDAVKIIKSKFDEGDSGTIILPEDKGIECIVWSPENGCYPMVIRAFNVDGDAFMTDECVGEDFDPLAYDYEEDEDGIVTTMSYDCNEIDWESVCQLADYLSGNTEGPQSLLEAIRHIKKEADEYLAYMFEKEGTEYDIKVETDCLDDNYDFNWESFVKATKEQVIMEDGDSVGYDQFTIDNYLQIIDGINASELANWGIDQQYFNVIRLHRDDLKDMVVNSDLISDEQMARVCEVVREVLLIGDYYEIVRSACESTGLPMIDKTTK